MTSTDHEELHSLYNDAIYEVDLAAGVESFVEGPNKSALPPFVVVTACNPGSDRPPDSENDAANARLEFRLRHAAHDFVTARGRNADSTHVEPSFAVFDISVDEALSLAVEFGQAAIFVWDGAIGSIAWTVLAR